MYRPSTSRSQSYLEPPCNYKEETTLMNSAPATLGTGSSNSEKHVVAESIVSAMDHLVTIPIQQEIPQDKLILIKDSEQAITVSIDEPKGESIIDVDWKFEGTDTPKVNGCDAINMLESPLLTYTQESKEKSFYSQRNSKYDQNLLLGISTDITASFQNETPTSPTEIGPSFWSDDRVSQIDQMPGSIYSAVQSETISDLDNDSLFYNQIHFNTEQVPSGQAQPEAHSIEDIQIEHNLPDSNSDMQINRDLVTKKLASPVISSTQIKNESKSNDAQNLVIEIPQDIIGSYQELIPTTQINHTCTTEHKELHVPFSSGAHVFHQWDPITDIHAATQNEPRARVEIDPPFYTQIDIARTTIASRELKLAAYNYDEVNFDPIPSYGNNDASLEINGTTITLLSSQVKKGFAEKDNKDVENSSAISPGSCHETPISQSQIMQVTHNNQLFSSDTGFGFNLDSIRTHVHSATQSRVKDVEDDTFFYTQIGIAKEQPLSRQTLQALQNNDSNSAPTNDYMPPEINERTEIQLSESTCTPDKGKRIVENDQNFQLVSSPDIMDIYDDIILTSQKQITCANESVPVQSRADNEVYFHQLDPKTENEPKSQLNSDTLFYTQTDVAKTNTSMQIPLAAHKSDDMHKLLSSESKDVSNEINLVKQCSHNIGFKVDASTQTEISGFIFSTNEGSKIKFKRSLEALCLESFNPKKQRYELKREVLQVVPANDEIYNSSEIELNEGIYKNDFKVDKYCNEINNKYNPCILYGSRELNKQEEYIQSINKDQLVEETNTDQEVPSNEHVPTHEHFPNGTLQMQVGRVCNFLWAVDAMQPVEQHINPIQQPSPAKKLQLPRLRLGLSKNSKLKQSLHKKSHTASTTDQ